MCCHRLHRGGALAETPEELMRSRYAAYALGDWDYIFRTWHPGTRPDDLGVAAPDSRLTWTGLEIEGSGLDDDTHGWVAFRAFYQAPSGDGVLTEHSRFEVRAGPGRVHISATVSPLSASNSRECLRLVIDPRSRRRRRATVRHDRL